MGCDKMSAGLLIKRLATALDSQKLKNAIQLYGHFNSPNSICVHNWFGCVHNLIMIKLHSHVNKISAYCCLVLSDCFSGRLKMFHRCFP